MPPWLPSLKLLFLSLAILLTAQTVISTIMRFSTSPSRLLPFAPIVSFSSAQASAGCGPSSTSADLSWHAPPSTPINNLATAINGTGTNSLQFKPIQDPSDTTYNYCNMPHVNPVTYIKAPEDYKLEYVELIHRHHKRTPYASNTFPVENYPWDCSDTGLFYSGSPLDGNGESSSANTYWRPYTDSANPFEPEGFPGNCQFPQITRGGLEDSAQHGRDLKAVYADLLSLIPADYDSSVTDYRVTNNVITSQVASALIAGMYPSLANRNVPLKIQPDSIDSLEPTYPCEAADNLTIAIQDTTPWRTHLTASAPLKRRLDALSGVDPDDEEWAESWDHYFDNLSSRLCHAKPLPCSAGNASECVSEPEANEVLRLGEWEYAYLHRGAARSLEAATAGYGVWVGELARNLRRASAAASSAGAEASSAGAAEGTVRYRHNVAHDGSISPLLSLLQIEEMVWPGMGAEVVFELYSRSGCFFVRVLYSGRVLRSSSPAFDGGEDGMLPLESMLGYFEGLVGVGGSKVPGMCGAGDAD